MPRSQSTAVAASGPARKQKQKPRPARALNPAPQRAPQGRKPRQQAQKPARRGFQSLPEYVKCVMDPFAMPACGYPDTFNQPTSKTKLQESYLLSSDAAGNICAQIAPSLNPSVLTNAVTTNVIQTGVAGGHPDFATINAQSAWIRTVCVGIQVDYVGAPVAACGTLTCIQDPRSDYWVGVSPASCVDDGESRPAIDGRKMGLVPTQPVRFESDAGTSYMTPTFPYMYILGTGLVASTALFRVTVVRHIEALPSKNAAMARGSATRTTASPMSFVALSGLDTDRESTPSSWSSALSVASEAAWDAVATAAAPLARSAAMSAVTMGLGAFGL